jgi:hypothetical protein
MHFTFSPSHSTHAPYPISFVAVTEPARRPVKAARSAPAKQVALTGRSERRLSSQISRRSSSRLALRSARRSTWASSNPNPNNTKSTTAGACDYVMRNNHRARRSKEHSQALFGRGGLDPGFLLCKTSAETTMAIVTEGAHVLEEEAKEKTLGNAEPPRTPRGCGRRRPAASRPSRPN